MKMQTVSLDDIVNNPWRDMKLFPVDADHVASVRDSINDHGFLGGIKGRRRNGKVELGCGHTRVAAARKAKLDSIQMLVGDMDDDAMLQLMTDENALQAGANPGAVMNEVAAVTRRLIEGLMEGVGTNVPIPPSIKNAFENKSALESAQGRLRKRLANSDADIPIGHRTIRAYLGHGNPDRSHRGERQIREAMAALKQSGRYDDIVEDELRKHPLPLLPDSKPSVSKEVATAKSTKPKRRILDERCANIFNNEHQFHAFREAVTTPVAQKAIPVSEQLALAKEIIREKHADFNKKQIGAPYIKRKIQDVVQEYLKKQREIDKEEKERYLRDQMEARIDDEVSNANSSLRGLISALGKMADLADKFPSHPKLGGFSARLDTLVDAIKNFSKKLK